MINSVPHSNIRPKLKGIFHIIALIVYILLFPYLYLLIPKGLKLPLTIYLLAVIFNFAASSLFHIIRWPNNIIRYPRQLDHMMIFILIAATYYAMISTFFYDVNLMVIYVLILGIISGIISRLCFMESSSIIIAIPYMLVGWSIILDPYCIIKTFDRSFMGAVFAVLASLSYIIGACIYVSKYPQLYPKIMGNHELFHIFVIMGTSLFSISIFHHGIPFYQNLKNDIIVKF